ncbi:MAG: glycosyltransferase family 9 protein [Candidatus Cloacimonetes bacterium]|nr:glycosyltransferase family 9 protein [Candidatus Cloacimonadota bacterium]
MYKVLFIRLSSIGDIVLTEPCVRLLKEHLPAVEIHYLTKPEYAEIIKSFPVTVDKIYELGSVHQTKSTIKSSTMKPPLHTILQLRKEKYDCVIDLHNKFSTFVVLQLLAAKRKIVYRKQHLTRRLMVLKLTQKSIDSVVWSYLETLQKLLDSKIDWDRIKSGKQQYPRLQPQKETQSRVYDTFTTYGINLKTTGNHLGSKVYKEQVLVGLFPGSQHFTKQYPANRIVNFLLSVPAVWNCVFVIFGDWKDKGIALEIKSLSGLKIYDMTGVFGLHDLITAVSLLDIVVTNDSGPMHIAAALQKPQIAIFGATHTRLGFRPLNDNAVVLQGTAKCQPCSLHGGRACRLEHLNCFREIESSKVFTEFEKLYNQIVEL